MRKSQRRDSPPQPGGAYSGLQVIAIFSHNVAAAGEGEPSKILLREREGTDGGRSQQLIARKDSPSASEPHPSPSPHPTNTHVDQVAGFISHDLPTPHRRLTMLSLPRSLSPTFTHQSDSGPRAYALTA